MTDRKKREPQVKLDFSFDEALARLVQTNPKEIADALEQVRSDEKEVEEYVKQREQSIGRGVRRAAKRFRL